MVKHCLISKNTWNEKTYTSIKCLGIISKPLLCVLSIFGSNEKNIFPLMFLYFCSVLKLVSTGKNNLINFRKFQYFLAFLTIIAQNLTNENCSNFCKN